MTDGIGKALASAFKGPTPAHEEKRGRHVFRNLHRRCLFAALTMLPCTGSAKLAEQCGISQSTAEWHLDVLLKSGWVVAYTSGRKRLYYPEGLITSEHSVFFEALNNGAGGSIFKSVLAEPGITQSGIASESGRPKRGVAKTLVALEGEGLIHKVMDGSHARYYPTRLLSERAEDFYARSREFAEFMLRKLGQEAGKPPLIIKKGVDRILVEAGFAADRFTLEVGTNPYMTCAVC